jgi:uncharacterized DUF497 family protein
VFEYDAKKSQSNQSKHGIDFERAQLLWDDPQRVEIEAKHTTEPRFMVIGQVAGKHWSAIVTYRNGNIRLISVRRSRDDEIKFYES